MKRDMAEITAKCVEVSKALINKQPGFQDFDLCATQTIGDTARLTANIRKFGILDKERLAAVSQAIKQYYRVVESVSLPILKDLGWIEINRDGMIEEYIPPMEDVLPVLGEVWEQKNPTGVEFATVDSLSLLKKRPYTKDALLSELDVPINNFETALDYGIQTSYFGTLNSEETNEEIVWSPFYWPGKTEKVSKYLRRQTYEEFEEIEKAMNMLSSYQGRPIEYIKGNRRIIKEGIESGFFPSVGVTGGDELKRYYVFSAAPQFGLDPNNDIFEKARLIVGCLRHGQYHAEGTKILYPILLLRSLRENRMRPHPYANIQYALLVMKGICNVTKMDYGNSYKVTVIDTPENQIAMDIAEEMLKGEEMVSGITQPEVNDKLFIKGTYNYSSEQRKIKNAEKIVANGAFERLLERIQSRSLD